MSYILEALKRAEAERGRGAVPTLQSQAAAVPTEVAQKPPVVRYVLIGVGALVLLIVGALVARWMQQPAAPVTPASPAVQPQLAERSVEKSAPPQFLPAPPPPRIEQRVEPRSEPRVEQRPPVVAAAPAPAPQPAPVKAAPAPTPVAATAAPAPTLAELPDATRRELPPLKVGGSMYSDTPSARMLILNGIVYHEGDALSPGLQLEAIGTRRATLSYKGQRFTLDY